MRITEVEISRGPPEIVCKKLSLRVVMAQEVRAKSNAERLIEMLVDEDSAFGKRDAQVRGLNLKDGPLEGNGVVVTDRALFFDGED